jgi:hypothetical protein
MSTHICCDNCGVPLSGQGTWGGAYNSRTNPFRFHVWASSSTRDKADLCEDCTLKLLLENIEFYKSCKSQQAQRNDRA